MTHYVGRDHGSVPPTGDLGALGGPLRTPEEVARYLRVDKETLRRWRRQRTGPPVVLCGPYTPRYPEDALITWMRDNTLPVARGRLAS